MAETFCFIGDGINEVWPLPFVPAREPVVSLIPPGGQEKRLLCGRDYSLHGANIVTPLAEGARLYARAEKPQARSIISTSSYAQERAAACPVPAAALSGECPAGAAEAGPVYLAENSGISEGQALEALERRYAELSSRLRLSFEKMEAELSARLAAEIREALAQALADLEGSRKLARDEARLASSPLSARSRLVLPSGCMAGAFLTVPAYFPGTNTLRLYLDGVLAAPEVDYEEVGVANEASVTVRMLKGLAPGTALDAIIEAIASSEAAQKSARTAQEAQACAARLLAAASEAQSQADKARASAISDSSLAQGWAGAAQKSADLAYQASVNAYDAAAQISLYRREPGICAVKDIAAIHACSPGLFIVNPHLTHAPTPFFGVWPAQCLHEMKWDGVFFLGGKCYPPDPDLPPRRPPRPQPDPAPLTGGSDEWIPCEHTHQSPPADGCGCAWNYNRDDGE